MSSSFSGSIHGGSVKLEDIIERESNLDEDEDDFSSSDEESVVDDRPYEERAPWGMSFISSPTQCVSDVFFLI